jgi:hypothetical protein
MSMRKSNWEEMLSRFPGFISGIRMSESDRQKFGIAHLIGAMRAKLEDLKAAGKQVVSVDRYVMEPAIAAQFFAFEVGGAKIYRLAREFAEDLSEVKLDIKAVHLPVTEDVICFEFPENVRFHLGDRKYAHCVYLFCTHERDLFHPDGKLRKGYLQMLIPLYNEFGQLEADIPIQEFGLSIFDLNAPLDEVISDSIAKSTYTYTNRKFIDFVVNCLVYLNSGDPDLREYRAPKPPKTNKAKEQRRWVRQHENQSLVNMTLVGYEWKKARTFVEGKVIRIGHPRWQPYKPGGPGTEWKVKLIWIEPTPVTVRLKPTKEENLTS